jgi:hypothetical protein
MSGKTLISVVPRSQRRWPYGSLDGQAHSEDAEFSVFLRDIPSTPVTDPFISDIHAIRNMDSRSAPAEVPPSESAKISFIQLSVFSSPIFRKSMTALVVFQKKLLHRSYGRLAKGGRKTRYEKRHEYATLFLSGSGLSAPKKSIKWSYNHTFKNFLMACVALIFSDRNGSSWMK